jgi:hypothetical protein
MWSTQDPVTGLGALRSASGWNEVSRLFGWLGSGFSACTSYRFKLVAAGVGGDLAYTVGYEHTSVCWDGVPMEPYILRVTHAYRREDGEWRIVHRHADAPRSIRLPQLTHRRSKRQGGPKVLPQLPVPSSWEASGPPPSPGSESVPNHLRSGIAALRSSFMSGTGPPAARAPERGLVAWEGAADRDHAGNCYRWRQPAKLGS